MSKSEEVAVLIEVTNNHLERLTNHRWNSFGPNGFDLANQEISALKKKLLELHELQKKCAIVPPLHQQQQHQHQQQPPPLPGRMKLTPIPAIPPRMRRKTQEDEDEPTGYCGLPEWKIPIKSLTLGERIESGGRFTSVYRDGGRSKKTNGP